jgi:hypothetical protein
MHWYPAVNIDWEIRISAKIYQWTFVSNSNHFFFQFAFAFCGFNNVKYHARCSLRKERERKNVETISCVRISREIVIWFLNLCFYCTAEVTTFIFLKGFCHSLHTKACIILYFVDKNCLIDKRSRVCVMNL